MHGSLNPVEPLFDEAGGQPFFDGLVDRFYDQVELNPVLRAMYPDDLTEPKVRLALFLGQFFGGPGAYRELRGNPRLRMRHVPFVIDQAARDAWFSYMETAVRASDLEDDQKSAMIGYFDNAATFLMNT